MGRVIKRIAQHLKKRDLIAIRRDADRLRDGARTVPTFFPAGSSGGHSEATRAVWDRWPDFVQAAALLEREAERLGDAASSPTPADIAEQFRAVTRACSTCHDTFRRKR